MLIILSADLASFYEKILTIYIFNFFFNKKTGFFAIKLANFLSIIPSFSLGNFSKSFSAIIKPNTLSLKQFSLLILLSKLLCVNALSNIEGFKIIFYYFSSSLTFFSIISS